MSFGIFECIRTLVCVIGAGVYVGSLMTSVLYGIYTQENYAIFCIAFGI